MLAEAIERVRSGEKRLEHLTSLEDMNVQVKRTGTLVTLTIRRKNPTIKMSEVGEGDAASTAPNQN